MKKPVSLSLVVALLMVSFATEAFAERRVIITPLRPQGAAQPNMTGPNQTGPIQQVSGVNSQGGPSIAYRMPYPTTPIQYPHMNAPMYPTPVPNVPVQVGGTVITNQAFAPQEMLYPHEYKSLYPPFYYKVRGKWLWTPWGIESHDHWELQGTEVKVKYRGTRRMFSGFSPPGMW